MGPEGNDVNAVVTARPASLQAYREVAQDAGEDLRAEARGLAAAVSAADRGAVDVPLPASVLEVVSELEGLGGDLRVLGAAVGRVGDAFAALEEGPAPVVRTSERDLAEELGPFAGVAGPGAWITGMLSSNALRLPLAAVGMGLAAQRTRMLVEMARAWARREWLQLTTPLRATAAGLGHLRRGQWRTAIPAVGDTLRSGRDAAAGQTRRLHGALDRAQTGWGAAGRLGRVLGPVGMLGDGYTLRYGSRYDGARGALDTGMAVVGIAAGGTLLVAGAVALSPVIVTTAVVGTVAATVWGVGNLAWDHRHTIADWGRSAGTMVASTASSVASTASSMAGSVASRASSAATTVASTASSVGSAASSAVSSVGGGLRSAGRVLGFGG
jgi:hypothetical protein